MRMLKAMAEAAYTFEGFAAHAKAVALRFEQRRMQFLRRLKMRCGIVLVLLLTFPMWFSLIEGLDNVTSGALSSLSWVLIHVIAGAVIVIGLVAWAVMPLFRYRHYTVQLGNTLPGVSGAVQQHVSLKGEIFGQLFRYFGDFALYEDRQLSLRSLRGAPDMPEFDQYVGEDYIRGAMHGVSVEITEMHLLMRRGRMQFPIFSGLMIVLDINDPGLVLRGRFSGKTVVIADRTLPREYVAMKYGDFRRAALPDGGFEQRFEAFTTDVDEAKRLLTIDLLRDLLRLSDAVRNAKNQVRHTDDRIAFAISGIASGFGDAMGVLATLAVDWFETGSLRRSPMRHKSPPPGAEVAPDAKGLDEAVHCAFYDDKVLITIPYRHNLFEPDVIFRAPLHQDDIRLAYDLMTMVGGIAQAVVKALPKEMV